jgi:hypothetical protein
VRRRRALALAVLAAVGALAGCGGDKPLPPSKMPVLIPACRGGRGPALTDRANDVTFHAFPGRRVRVTPPPPSIDLRQAALTVTDRMVCLTVRTTKPRAQVLDLTIQRAGRDDDKSWKLALFGGTTLHFFRPGSSGPEPVPGARVVTRGSLLEVAAPRSSVADAPFGDDFEWQLTTRKSVLGPGGRVPPAAEQVDCLTQLTQWVQFPAGTRVRRSLPEGIVGPGCAR